MLTLDLSPHVSEIPNDAYTDIQSKSERLFNT